MEKEVKQRDCRNLTTNLVAQRQQATKLYNGLFAILINLDFTNPKNTELRTNKHSIDIWSEMNGRLDQMFNEKAKLLLCVC